jgi:threonylcarbamoyladenosine tRNA methylthiotransferase MtaB
MRPRVALVRLGCRVNQADAEAVLRACGARPPRDGVDAVLVSTCVVTADAESTAFQAVRRAARDHPGVPVVVCGCAGALKGRELAALTGVAAVVEPGDVERAALAIRSAVEASNGARRPPSPAPVRSAARAAAGGSQDSTRARPTLKIQDGCDQRCAYCVVPLARGRSRSLSLESALERAAALGRERDEVVLAGIHLGAYGHDLGGREPARATLGRLIATIAGRRLVHRLRLSSIDPLEVPFDALTGPSAELVCRHLHLPVQSGSDRILAAMRRPYAARDVAAAVERISRAAPGACIEADVMTGFPGETDADHRATLALVASLPLAALHVFTFSPRAGTAAAAMPDQVASAIARERAAELRGISARAWRAYVDGLAGREVEAVVERADAGEARGTTREGVLARWRVATGEDVPLRGRAIRLRAVAREGEDLRCVRA